MPQKQVQDLPSQVKEQLADGSEQIFLAALNSAQDNGMDEQAAMNVAWNSVKEYYDQGSDGKWHRKPEEKNIHHKAVQSGGN